MRSSMLWKATGFAAAMLLAGPSVQAANVDFDINVAPPAPIYEETPPPREGYVWAQGYWDYDNGQHVWRKGHWEQDHPGEQWTNGGWTEHDGHYQLDRGHWAHDGDHDHDR
jgi:hypothetical protein